MRVLTVGTGRMPLTPEEQVAAERSIARVLMRLMLMAEEQDDRDYRWMAVGGLVVAGMLLRPSEWVDLPGEWRAAIAALIDVGMQEVQDIAEAESVSDRIELLIQDWPEERLQALEPADSGDGTRAGLLRRLEEAVLASMGEQ